jgi:hypothetical protein
MINLFAAREHMFYYLGQKREAVSRLPLKEFASA